MLANGAGRAGAGCGRRFLRHLGLGLVGRAIDLEPLIGRGGARGRRLVRFSIAPAPPGCSGRTRIRARGRGSGDGEMGSAVTVAAPPRGQAKSSARPVGAGIGSPLVRTRVATGSERAAVRGRRHRPAARRRRPCRHRERHHRAGQRTRRGPPGLGGGRSRLERRQRDRHGAIGHVALDFALDVVGELARAGLGEIDAVAGPQAAGFGLRNRGPAACSGRRSSTKPSQTST